MWNTFAQSLCNGFLVAANRDFCRKTITREYAAAAAAARTQHLTKEQRSGRAISATVKLHFVCAAIYITCYF